MNPGRVVHQPQHEIVVLGALVAASEAADPFDQRAAHHHQVAGVHVGQEVIGRPVRLEVHVAPPAVELELVLVRVDEVGILVLVQMRNHFEQRVRGELVVVVEKRDEFALRKRQRFVRRDRDAAVGGQPLDFDPRIALVLAKYSMSLRPRRPVVRQAQLPVGIRLALDRFDARAQPSGIGVVDGRHDADERPIRK